MGIDFRRGNAAEAQGYLSQPGIPCRTIQVSGGCVAENVRMNIFDTRPADFQRLSVKIYVFNPERSYFISDSE
jgi:hypothetical protein